MNIIYRFLRLFLLTLHFQSNEAATKTQSVGAIRFTDASASYNESFGNVSIAVSNNKLNLYFYNRYPLRNVTFDMDINAKTASATEYKSYFKRSLDYCKFSSNPLSDPFIKVIYEGLRKDKNNKILGKCPVMPVSFCSNTYKMILITCFIDIIFFLFLWVITECPLSSIYYREHTMQKTICWIYHNCPRCFGRI